MTARVRLLKSRGRRMTEVLLACMEMDLAKGGEKELNVYVHGLYLNRQDALRFHTGLEDRSVIVGRSEDPADDAILLWFLTDKDYHVIRSMRADTDETLTLIGSEFRLHNVQSVQILPGAYAYAGHLIRDYLCGGEAPKQEDLATLIIGKLPTEKEKQAKHDLNPFPPLNL